VLILLFSWILIILLGYTKTDTTDIGAVRKQQLYHTYVAILRGALARRREPGRCIETTRRAVGPTHPDVVPAAYLKE
jgi:hypothetical protein